MNRLAAVLSISIALGLTACASTSGSSDAAVRPYPLDRCVVMDSRLGSMGDPITRVYNGQEVKFCCEPCIEEFESDPEYYLAQMRAQQKE